jgi:RNase H-fold protein (predicted Holliday junction resolvase)
MRILALITARRIGVAVSDELKLIATLPELIPAERLRGSSPD